MINVSQFQWPIRIYYEDTDAGGVVYYANYLKFMERARTEWLRALGVEQDLYLAQQIAFVVRKVEVDYLNSARFNDELTVSCELIERKRASLVFQQTVRSACQQKQYVTGRVTIACVDLSRGRPVAIPQPIMEVLTRVG